MRTVLTFALMLAATGVAAADDAFLSRLVGDWTGRGAMRITPTAQMERVYCKISNTLGDGGTTLTQKGRCSLASNSGPIDGTISALGSNLYGGALNSLASKGPATIAGSATANRLELNADYVDSFDGKPTRSVITIDIASDGYRLISTRIDPATGEPYTASEIAFTK